MVKYICLMSFLFVGCYGFLRGTDEPLTMKKQYNLTNSFNLNGYYYHKDSTTNSYRITFYYANGAFIRVSGGKINLSLLELDEELYRDTAYINSSKLSKDNWGLYQLKSDKILIQGWNCGYYCAVFNQIGKIINRDSIILEDTEYKNGSSKTFIGNFKFRQFDYKPDSTKVEIYLKPK